MSNERGLLVSNKAIGSHAMYGLADRGIKAASTNLGAEHIRKVLGLATIVRSSPFARCTQVADIAVAMLKLSMRYVVDDRLSERWFGEYDMLPFHHYADICTFDRSESSCKLNGVESLQELTQRMLGFIDDMEDMFEGQTILAITHDDPIRALHCAVHGKSAATAKIPYCDFAQIIELTKENHV